MPVSVGAYLALVLILCEFALTLYTFALIYLQVAVHWPLRLPCCALSVVQLWCKGQTHKQVAGGAPGKAQTRHVSVCALFAAPKSLKFLQVP